MSALQTGVCNLCCGLIWAVCFAIFGFGANPWECWGYDSVAALSDTSTWDSSDWSSSSSWDTSDWSSSSSWDTSDWSSSSTSWDSLWDSDTMEVTKARSPDCVYYTTNVCTIEAKVDVDVDLGNWGLDGMSDLLDAANDAANAAANGVTGTRYTEAQLTADYYVNVSASWNGICAFGFLVYLLQFLFGIFGIIAGRSGKRNCLMCANILNAFVTLLWIGLVIALCMVVFTVPSMNCAGAADWQAADNNAPPLQPAQGSFLWTVTIVYLCFLPYVICAVVCCICVLMAVMAMPQ